MNIKSQSIQKIFLFTTDRSARQKGRGQHVAIKGRVLVEGDALKSELWMVDTVHEGNLAWALTG